ncbi:hypothetical protein ATCC90586_003392 [Pythium insidiosum]|nr:hypothetical protein ATCC90586_003392 [Pythium insidiosum]
MNVNFNGILSDSSSSSSDEEEAAVAVLLARRSPLLDGIVLSGSVQNNVKYKLNGKVKRHGYYLVDGIYPEWACFAKPIGAPETEKEKNYNQAQQSRRKDVELAFGIVKSKFQILAKPIQYHNREAVTQIVYTCIILHNMCIEYSGRAISSQGTSDSDDNSFGTESLPSDDEIDVDEIYEIGSTASTDYGDGIDQTKGGHCAQPVLVGHYRSETEARIAMDGIDDFKYTYHDGYKNKAR